MEAGDRLVALKRCHYTRPLASDASAGRRGGEANETGGKEHRNRMCQFFSNFVRWIADRSRWAAERALGSGRLEITVERCRWA